MRPGLGAHSVEGALQAKQVLAETLTVNGEKGDYTVSSSALSLEDALAALKPLVADWKAATGSRSILIETEDDDKWLVRYYLVSMGDRYQTMIFRLKIPRDAAQADGSDQWPRDVPQPRADKLGPVMKLGKRDTTYANFSGGDQYQALAREYHAQLRREGWAPLGGLTPTGGVYVDAKQKYLLVVSLMEGRRGVTRGAILLTPYGPRRTE